MALLTTLLILLILAIIWLVIKFVFKLTLTIFSCGCLLILVIGALIFFASYFATAPAT